MEATVEGDTASLKANDFVITNTYSKANYAVKSVSVDATDKTKVTVETFVSMNDGKDYTVVLDGTTKTITATDGKVVAATIAPATVTVPTPANNSDGTNANDIKVTFTDANGIKVMDVTPIQASAGVKPDGFSLVEIKVDATNNGYLSGNTLTLYKAGNTAKITVIAHTGKYDSSAQEVGNVTAEATVTGVDAAAVTTAGWNVKIAKGLTGTNKEFSTVTESKVAVKDSGVYAYVQRTTSDNKTVAASDYTFESSDKDVMYVEKTALATVKDATAVSITPYKVGTAYIIVKDSKGAVVTTLPVTIGEARKAATLTLDKTAFTLSNASGVDTKVKVKATVKDQYGADFAVTDLGYKKVAVNDGDVYTPVSNEFEVENPGIEKATDSSQSYTYIVKTGDLKATFVITVRRAEKDIATYALELSADSADAVIKGDATSDTTITAKVCGYDKNGVKVSDGVEGATFKLSKDGKDATDAIGVGNSASIAINNLSTGKQMAAGTYLVTATAEGKTFTKTFTVTNSQLAVSANRVKTTASSVGACFEFTYDGKKLENPTVKFIGLNDEDVTAATGTVAIAKAVVVVPVGNNSVEQTVSIGLTVTIQ